MSQQGNYINHLESRKDIIDRYYKSYKIVVIGVISIASIFICIGLYFLIR